MFRYVVRFHSTNPTTGIADCCARAASGHVAAAVPTSVMKSRRLIAFPAREYAD